MVALRFDCAPLRRAEQKKPTRSPTAASKLVAPYPALSRRPFGRIPAGAEAPACRCRGLAEPPVQAHEVSLRPPRIARIPRAWSAEKGRGKNPVAPPDARRTHPTNPADPAEPDRALGLVVPADPNGGAAHRTYDACFRLATAAMRGPRTGYPNSVAPAESAAHEIAGLRGFSDLASATPLEAAFADERDDASRLAQRCYLRPHSARSCRTRSCDCGRV